MSIASLLRFTNNLLENENTATLIWMLICMAVISQFGLRGHGLLSAWRACRCCGRKLNLLRRLVRVDGFCNRGCWQTEQRYIDQLSVRRLADFERLQKTYSPLPFEGVRRILIGREQDVDHHLAGVIASERRMAQLRPWIKREGEQRRAAAAGGSRQ
jgi:hypothetical protein